MSYRIEGDLWVYQGPGAWRFITLPTELSRRIKALAPRRNAFGSLRVVATIGATTWTTSLFFDTKADAFLLPVKADVRKRERIADGDTVQVTLDPEF